MSFKFNLVSQAILHISSQFLKKKNIPVGNIIVLFPDMKVQVQNMEMVCPFYMTVR